MNLLLSQLGTEYIIKAIKTEDEELEAFLFSLGCYSGEPITVISAAEAVALLQSRMADIASIINLRRLLL